MAMTTLRRGLLGTMATAMALAGGIAGAGTAQAADVRAGAEDFQVDVLLDDEETRRAASSLWGTTVTCWGVGAAAASVGAGGALALGGTGLFGAAAGVVLGGGGCVAVVATCAAQAVAVGREAGLTVSPTGFWCWQYDD